MSEFKCGCPGEHTAYCRKRRKEYETVKAALIATIGLDPGDKHTGWAIHTPVTVYSGEIHYEEGKYGKVLIWLEEQLLLYRRHGYEVEVVIEEFRLYENQAQKKIGSDFPTVQLIGGIKTVCGKLGVGWVEQGAHIKKPTRRQLRARGIAFKAKAAMGHVRDAETHTWHRVLRRKK